MKNNVKFTFSVGDTPHGRLQVVLTKTNRRGDTKHNI